MKREKHPQTVVYLSFMITLSYLFCSFFLWPILPNFSNAIYLPHIYNSIVNNLWVFSLFLSLGIHNLVDKQASSIPTGLILINSRPYMMDCKSLYELMRNIICRLIIFEAAKYNVLLSCKLCHCRLRGSSDHLTNIYGASSITSQSPLNTRWATKSRWRHQNQRALAKTWWGGV